MRTVAVRVRSRMITAGTLLLAAGTLLLAPAARSAATISAGSSVAVPSAAPDARFVPATTDSTLDRFFGDLSDSTDRYFGRTAAPVDTTGLDSARSAGLLLPPPGVGRRLRVGFGPALRFNRVDGAVYGVTSTLRAGVLGRLEARGEYRSGPQRGQGGARWIRVWSRDESSWIVTARGGRETAVMDRSRPMSVGDAFASLGAWTSGSDTRQYFGRAGYGLVLERATPRWRVLAGWRDEVEQPLRPTATWNLSRRADRDPGNLAATPGRAREALLGMVARVPQSPIRAQIDYRTARRALGSDFEYRSLRVAAGADIGLGRWSSLVPQAMIGELTGDLVPQESFDLDGAGVLVTRSGDRIAGSRIAVGRCDWIGTRDLLGWLPHPAMFPIQGDLFADAGSAWGADPYGGARRPGGFFPQGPWSSEAGFALVWQPGLPDPVSLARIELAWPLDGRTGGPGVRVSLRRPLFLVRPLFE